MGMEVRVMREVVFFGCLLLAVGRKGVGEGV